MDQRGFVEISHFKNEQLYRAYLPMGVQWSEVHAALTELCDEVGAHVVAVEQSKWSWDVRDGQIEFCSDSTHALSGQTVPLPDWP